MLAHDNPPRQTASSMAGEWIKVGRGDRTDYVRLRQRGDPTSIAADFPGPFARYDHAAGEPWVSFHMREWIEIEGTDIWPFLCAAVASSDEAVIEQCAQYIDVIWATQDIFRRDGSFANEPGSYGWGPLGVHRGLVAQMEEFLGPNRVHFGEDFHRRLLNCLVMWNDFPFSDGMHPMLNGGGAVKPPGRLAGHIEPRALELLRMLFPEEKTLIARYEKNHPPTTGSANREASLRTVRSRSTAGAMPCFVGRGLGIAVWKRCWPAST